MNGSGLPREPGGVRGTEAWGLFFICVAFACGYAVYGLFRHWHFGSSAYDLGIFDQAVWHLSRFEAPASTISGFSNILGDHFYPIIALFAPLYWLAPSPETLIVAQAVLFAASIVPVYLYLRDRLPVGARALTIAYGLFWGLQRAAAFDVHEAAFAPLFIATAILAMERRLWPLVWTAAAALVLVKEDLIPLVGGFGAYLIMKGHTQRGLWLLAASVVAFACITVLVVPAFNDAQGYAYTPLYRDLLRQPWRVPLLLVTPPVKIETVFLWLAPFVLMSLASPLSVLLIPLALERLLSPFPQHWGTTFHYSAPLAPIVAMSAGDGLARLGRRIERFEVRRSVMRRRKPDTTDDRLNVEPGPLDGTTRWAWRLMTAVAVLSVVLSALLPGNQPFWRLLTWRHYASTSSQRAGYEALGLVPRDASVVAQAAVAPHVSERKDVFMLESRAPDSDYVIAAAGLSPWPADRFDELQMLLEDRRRRGYSVLFDREGWVVLRRPARQTQRLPSFF